MKITHLFPKGALGIGQPPTLLDLERYDSTTKTWSTILKRVALFDIQKQFMYASVYKSETPRSEVMFRFFGNFS